MDSKISAMEKVMIARNVARPKIKDYIYSIFTDFFEQKGDYIYGDDKSILGGIALFEGTPVTVIGHKKGSNLEENVVANFGMPQPEGYRKAVRLMEQAEKFKRPVITFIDTPGAYPGIEAEEHGQSRAIARSLARMSTLRVPVIAIITGEGNSGGALAIGVANTVLMMENAVYSILSPEGFASIVWKDAKMNRKASELMKMTAADLMSFGVIDGVISEPKGGAHMDLTAAYNAVKEAISRELYKYSSYTGEQLADMRYKKFRSIDHLYMLGKGKRNL